MRTVPPATMRASFISSGFIVMVLTIAWYSGLSLPTLICWPCLVVRPAFMRNRLPGIDAPSNTMEHRYSPIPSVYRRCRDEQGEPARHAGGEGETRSRAMQSIFIAGGVSGRGWEPRHRRHATHLFRRGV